MGIDTRNVRYAHVGMEMPTIADEVGEPGEAHLVFTGDHPDAYV